MGFFVSINPFKKRYGDFMKKFLAFLCYLADLASMAAAGWFSYSVFKGEMAFELGIMIFIPLMIMSYWFSTFFYQLTSPKCTDGKRHSSLNKWLGRVLSWVSNVITFGLLVFWVYLLLFQSDLNRTVAEWWSSI